MKIVLMAGGKGTRLWPLSTNDLPKQFLTVRNMKKSMLNVTYDKVKKINKNIYVATQKEYADVALFQTEKNTKIITEPYSHDTFAAFLNVAVYLKYEERIDDNEVIALLPVDHDVSENFYKILSEAKALLNDSNSDFCLVGIKPTYPSTQYGYIMHENSCVKKFLEKPDEGKASKLINRGAVWNSGILIFKLSAMIKISKEYCFYKNYQEFVKLYNTLPKNSFDYEVLEKLNNIMIVLSEESWMDLGNWNTLYEKISKSDDNNTNIINTETKEVKNFGVKNSVIINTPYGLALYPKEIDNKKTFRRWGCYEILDNYSFDKTSIEIKRLEIYQNRSISCQTHNFRDTFWMILDGYGEVIINGSVSKIKKGDICNIKAGDNYVVKAIQKLEIMEIQRGEKATDGIEK